MWTIRRSKHVPRHVAGYHQVAVVCSVYVDEFRSDTDSRKQIPPSGTPAQTLAHNPVIRESDPSSREFSRGTWPVLRGSEVGHRCREQGERDNGHFRRSSKDACVSHWTSRPGWANQPAIPLLIGEREFDGSSSEYRPRTWLGGWGIFPSRRVKFRPCCRRTRPCHLSLAQMRRYFTCFARSSESDRTVVA